MFQTQNTLMDFGQSVRKGDKAIELRIYETTNWEQFKLPSGNRKIQKSHLFKLKQSFAKRTLFTLIYVNERMEVIDGNHRLEVCKSLKIPVKYVILKGYGLNEMQILNTNTKNWSKKDYLDSYCELGYEDYINARKFWAKYPEFTLDTILSILSIRYTVNKMGSNKDYDGNSTGNYLDKIFEKGEFKIVDINKSEKLVKQILDYQLVYPDFAKINFVRTIISIHRHKDYNHTEMLKRLETAPYELRIQKAASVMGYKEQIQKAYNFNRRKNLIDLINPSSY